jgi:hypothetical protein
MSEMTCTTRQAAAGGTPASGANNAKGYQHHATYTVPAVVPLGFPAGSSNLSACYASAVATAPADTRGTVHVTITDR